MRRLLLPLVLGFLAAPALAQQPVPGPPMMPRTLTVTATDTVLVAPDQVTLRFSVVTRAAEPEPARRQNAEAAEAALNAVRALGIPDRRIQLLSLRLEEDIEYQDGRRVHRGYVARRDVKVVLDDLDALPPLVAAVVQQGANELGGIEYGLQDRQAAEDRALQAASARAREKAEVLAAALGVTLGRVVAAFEGSMVVAPPQPLMHMARAEMAFDMSEAGAYAAGEIEVQATMTVSFEIQ